MHISSSTKWMRYTIYQRTISDNVRQCQTMSRLLELHKIAVKQNWYALYHIKPYFRTEELCMLAVQYHGEALQFVPKQTEAMCIVAVKHNGFALQHVS